MAANAWLSASEVLDLLDRVQRDPQRRSVLASSWEIYQAALSEDLVAAGNIDELAGAMQELTADGLIAFATTSGGVIPRPEGAAWDGTWLQQLSRWRVTATGRADAKLYRDSLPREGTSDADHAAVTGKWREGFDGTTRDVFISHASEDKTVVARPLAEQLVRRGWSVWLDESELTVGDSLECQINAGLSQSRFGVVILSPSFFAKEFPQRELQGLAAREVSSGTKVILPVWHNIDRARLLEFSPVLADKLGAPTSKGIASVAQEIDRALSIAAERAPGTRQAEHVLQPVPLTDAASSPGAGPATDPGTNAALALAMVLRDQGDLLTAEVYLRRATEAGSPDALTLLGMLLRDQGRGADAETYLRRAMLEGQAEALTPLGMVLEERGNPDEAEIILRKAVDAGRPEALVPLGMLLHKRGALDEAAVYLRRAADG